MIGRLEVMHIEIVFIVAMTTYKFDRSPFVILRTIIGFGEVIRGGDSGK